ncbi:MFS transporter [Amycolatopsis umgeniensis]|uniref:MFS family permease n=1 Tax=Amycolatopsis umgeniensis TaxID=336628 RepID=A0A841B9D4_9PSEU|nr:MFS transporter [Amycolatopsis umgeniensis]MBB5857509.1 MFS family permease [Amycolatopsis umgeniensis]
MLAFLRLPNRATELIGAATLVLSIGGGAWYTCWAIFFTRSLGLSAAQVGIGLTAAGVFGMLTGSVVGFVADRVGSREVLIVLGAIQGLSTFGYIWVHEFWGFLAVACVATAAERSILGIRLALVSSLAPEPDRIRSIALIRVLAHAGFAVGSGVGALVLNLDTRAAYIGLVLVHGLASLVFALVVHRVPHVQSLRDINRKRKVLVLRDRPFMVMTVLSAVLALCWGVGGAAIPLWIANHTEAPMWIAGAIAAINAVGIITLQTRVSRSGATVPGAARLGVYCGLVLAACCGLFAATYHGSGWLVIVLLLLAGIVHVLGELLYVASGWGLSVGLTKDEAHGEYQGMYNTGTSAAQMLAPALMTMLIVDWGIGGWILLAGLFVVAGSPTVLVGRWALRDKREQPVRAGHQDESSFS